jgi:N-glycosylase/DNA lyase
MSEPKANENVIAFKRDAGKVMVHGWRKQQRVWDAITDCSTTPSWHLRSWLWVEYRTLNPSMVMLCKRCWRPF